MKLNELCSKVAKGILPIGTKVVLPEDIDKQLVSEIIDWKYDERRNCFLARVRNIAYDLDEEYFHWIWRKVEK